VTVLPGAPTESADDAVTAPDESPTTAFGLLSRAQAIADHLQSQVEAEVAAMRAEAGVAQDEARRLLADASNVHEDAVSAQRSAQARLEEAQQEAAQLVADAADQASLVAEAANVTTENLLARTQEEAGGIRKGAKAEQVRLLALATTELEQVREDNARLLSESAAGIESRRLKVTAELQLLAEQANDHAASIRAAAEGSCGEAISRADTEAGATRDAAAQELTQARTETAQLRSTAAAEIASARDTATAEADRVLGDAAEQLHWTQDTIASLLSTAKAEADRLRLADHEEVYLHLGARRRQLQDVISRVTLRARVSLAEAAAEAQRLRAQAEAVLDAAEKDTIATRDHVLAHADRVIAEADLTAQAATERGQRRLHEAESGSRVLRERAAAEVARLQTEAHEHRRAVRDEATKTLAAARGDADKTRAEARDLLRQARAEVKVLADRRDDIAAQLGHLSGVIEALAVPERAAITARLSKPPADRTELIPITAPPDLSLTTNATTGTR